MRRTTPRTSNDERPKQKQRCSERTGYLKVHDFAEYEDLLSEISVRVCAYLEHGSKATLNELMDVQDYVQWSPLGVPFQPFDAVENEGPFNEWVMSLVKVRTSVLTKQTPPTSSTMAKWLSVRKSRITNAGLGLFAERYFKKDEIITVFCGRLKKTGCALDDTLVSFKRENGTVVFLNTRPSGGKHFYFGAHLANNPHWGKTEEERAKMSKTPWVKGCNAIIQPDMTVIATQEIRRNVEIRLMYQPLCKK